MNDPTRFIVAIPARHAASRLPGKPLRLLGGEPLIRHVVRHALAAGADAVYVASDDARIEAALVGCGAQVVATGAHASGTDRLAACADLAGWGDATVVVNLQGDEPFAPASGIRAVACALVESGAVMATLAEPLQTVVELLDPNTVKVVRGADGDALYFSRAPIPWHRDAFADGATSATADTAVAAAADSGTPWLRHIGIYAYRAGFLRRFAAMPPGRLEQVESLEQLRVLEAGLRIAVGLAPEPFPPGVDTLEDLVRAEARLAGLA